MASRRFRIEFTVDMDCWDADDIEAFAIQELTSMSPYPRDIEFSGVGWHTGTPSDDGYYLCHSKDGHRTFDACFYRKNGAWDIGEYSINPYTFEVIAWQRVEPFKEASE